MYDPAQAEYVAAQKILETVSEETDSIWLQVSFIVNSILDGVFVVNSEGKILLVNKAYERITGISPRTLIGDNILNLEKQRLFTPIVTPTILETRRPYSVMQSFKTGKSAIVTGTPVFDENGEIRYIISTIRDITELNELRKELLKANQMTESYKTQLSVMQIQNLEQDNVIAKSSKMNNIITSALHVAQFDTTVLLTGESGVGKEVIAKLIHKSSERSKNPYITVNCGAIAPSLLESELLAMKRRFYRRIRQRETDCSDWRSGNINS